MLRSPDIILNQSLYLVLHCFLCILIFLSHLQTISSNISESDPPDMLQIIFSYFGLFIILHALTNSLKIVLFSGIVFWTSINVRFGLLSKFLSSKYWDENKNEDCDCNKSYCHIAINYYSLATQQVLAVLILLFLTLATNFKR